MAEVLYHQYTSSPTLLGDMNRDFMDVYNNLLLRWSSTGCLIIAVVRWSVWTDTSLWSWTGRWWWFNWKERVGYIKTWHGLMEDWMATSMALHRTWTLNMDYKFTDRQPISDNREPVLCRHLNWKNQRPQCRPSFITQIISTVYNSSIERSLLNSHWDVFGISYKSLHIATAVLVS